MFNSFAIVLTTRCNDWCEICTIAPLERDQEVMLTNDALGFIDQAAPLVTSFDEKRLEILGGEPFTEFQSLLGIIRHATELGFKTEVSTNAFWATDNERTQMAVGQLRDAGLRTLVIVTDTYHLKFVPLDNIRHLVESLRDAGFLLSLIFRVNRSDFIPPDLLSLDRINSGITDIIVEPWLPLGYHDPTASDMFALDSIFPPPVPCRSRLRLIVTPSGNVFPCLAGSFIQSFKMGNLKQEPLSTIVKRMEGSPFLQRFYKTGPAGSISSTDKHIIEERLHHTYADNCWLCHTIFTNPALSDIASKIGE